MMYESTGEGVCNSIYPQATLAFLAGLENERVIKILLNDFRDKTRMDEWVYACMNGWTERNAQHT
jgi:hypothetical protein